MELRAVVVCDVDVVQCETALVEAVALLCHPAGDTVPVSMRVRT